MKNKVQSNKGKKHSSLIAWLICLLASFSIWLYVMATASPAHEDSFFSVPVTIQNADVLASEAGLAVISDSELTVDVTVTGTKKDFVKYSISDFSISVDVSGIETAGKHTLDVTVILPDGMSCKSVTPSSVTLHVDSKISKAIPVKAVITSEPTLEENCKLGDPTPEITSITVEGPEAIIAGISHAQLDLNLKDVDGTTTKTVAVRLIDANGKEISQKSLTLSQNTIDVEIPIYKFTDK